MCLILLNLKGEGEGEEETSYTNLNEFVRSVWYGEAHMAQPSVLDSIPAESVIIHNSRERERRFYNEENGQ